MWRHSTSTEGERAERNEKDGGSGRDVMFTLPVTKSMAGLQPLLKDDERV